MFVLDTDHLGILQARTLPEIDRLSTRMGQYAAEDFFVVHPSEAYVA